MESSPTCLMFEGYSESTISFFLGMFSCGGNSSTVLFPDLHRQYSSHLDCDDVDFEETRSLYEDEQALNYYFPGLEYERDQPPFKNVIRRSKPIRTNSSCDSPRFDQPDLRRAGSTETATTASLDMSSTASTELITHYKNRDNQQRPGGQLTPRSIEFVLSHEPSRYPDSEEKQAAQKEFQSMQATNMMMSQESILPQ